MEITILYKVEILEMYQLYISNCVNMTTPSLICHLVCMSERIWTLKSQSGRSDQL